MLTDNCFGERGVREEKNQGYFLKLRFDPFGCRVMALTETGKPGRGAAAGAQTENSTLTVQTREPLCYSIYSPVWNVEERKG